MTINEIRKKYLEYFKSPPRNHVEIKPSTLVLNDDPTTLFTSSGMQPLVTYLLGEEHPEGVRLVDSQPSIRLQDIEEVGDLSHTTFFEMLGNWSLGDYFKDEQLPWFWEFLTKELSLPKERLFVSVFEGNDAVPKDEISAEIWKKLGVPESRIFYHGVENNWWSRSGPPDKMPPGEIGGPDSEVFFEFPQIEHDKKYGKKCEPGCDCGRYLEIGNSVFMQYKKSTDGELEELPNKNVDFGGGLERIAAAVQDTPDVFEIDVFKELIGETEKNLDVKYEGENKPPMRVIADHIRAATFLVANDVYPSNKEQGYVLRRLIRRASLKARQLSGSIDESAFNELIAKTVDYYSEIYLAKEDKDRAVDIVTDEVKKFKNTLERGLKEIEKIETINAKKAFDLYQSYGFPVEITEEIFEEKGQKIDKSKFTEEFEKHKNLSRTTSAGKFKGGLSGSNEKIKRLHTTAHLLQATLREKYGNSVAQKGQNITEERLRFDFSSDKPPDDIEFIERIINKHIEASLPVKFVEMDKQKAKETGAIHLFDEKYPESVKVYYIGDDLETAVSKEFCGGPHVDNTNEIGRVRIKNSKKIGAEIYRIYAYLA